MPSTERFRARPIGACLEPCPLREITSFELDSSRSRKSVFFGSHTFLLRTAEFEHKSGASASGNFLPATSKTSNDETAVRAEISRKPVEVIDMKMLRGSSVGSAIRALIK
jgi:hypothetical protein